MALQIRRGTNNERLQITPLLGEPIWTTDTKKLYIGDGSTVGGNLAGGTTTNTTNLTPATVTATETIVVGTGTTHVEIDYNGIVVARGGQNKLQIGFSGNGIQQLGDGDPNEFYGPITIHGYALYANAGINTNGVFVGQNILIWNDKVTAPKIETDKVVSNGVETSGVLVENITNGDQAQLDDFDTAVYRSAKYYIQADDGTNIHIQEMVVMYDGSNVVVSEYGIITSAGTLGTFAVDTIGQYVRLLFTPDNAGATFKVRIAKTLMAV